MKPCAVYSAMIALHRLISASVSGWKVLSTYLILGIGGFAVFLVVIGVVPRAAVIGIVVGHKNGCDPFSLVVFGQIRAALRIEQNDLDPLRAPHLENTRAKRRLLFAAPTAELDAGVLDDRPGRQRSF